MGSIVEWYRSYVGGLFVIVYRFGKGEDKLIGNTNKGFKISL